jgi:hypothetical protein
MVKQVRYIFILLISASALFYSSEAFSQADFVKVESPTSFIKSTTVFPNPATDFLHVRTEHEPVENIEFSLHNLIGNKLPIETEQINENEIRIRVKDLSSGYYLVRMVDKNTNAHHIIKFVKR